MIAVGLLFVAIGAYGYFHMGGFLDSASETSAVVVEMLNESATRKGRTHPVVRFTTTEGRTVVARSNKHHSVQPGETVTLLYDPRNPHDIEITTRERASRRRLLFTGASIALGLFVCTLGAKQRVR